MNNSCLLDHIQSIVASSNELREDIQKFKDSLTLMFNKKNMVPVFFERNFKTQHLQVSSLRRVID